MDIFESLENLEVSEECFNDIMGIVEQYILELNKYEQYKLDKNPELKKEVEKRQEALKEIGDLRKEVDSTYAGHTAVDTLADENREALKRNEPLIGHHRISKVSFSRPERHSKIDKNYSGQKAIRTEQSQRGSSKDVWNSMDPLMHKVRKVKGLVD